MAFTNFVYRPAILKLCKNAGPGVAVGTPFTFSIAPLDPLTTWPYPAGNITVQAGTCVFVNGPFPADANFPGVGLFNFGTSIIVTEAAAAGTAITWYYVADVDPDRRHDPPNGPNFVGTLTVDIPNRRGTMTLNNVLGLPIVNPTNFYFNELTFTNAAAVIAPPARPPVTISTAIISQTSLCSVRPMATGTISAVPPVQLSAVHFGQAGDIPVAADFDGDGVTDPAVYRNGQWFVLGSTAGFSSLSFGLATDIPQVGDYDGDGRADFAVYRQSNGTWYIMGSAAGFSAVQFGNSTDIPAAADFDGDGKMDPAVFRVIDRNVVHQWKLNRLLRLQFRHRG